MYTTRIAPSPTGDMHIGTARTAYFNWLAARASGGKFILRIDDTDPSRSKPEYVDVIIETLKWLGLDYDELAFQSHRFDRYRELAAQSLDRGWAFKEEGAIRLRVPDGEADLPGKWHDEIVGEVAITDDDYQRMEGTVLIRADDTPTYHWASVIDDIDMRVNFIIRGTDHTTNTAKQMVLWHLLARLLSQDYNPKFAHVGLIGEKGKPLSKREGAASMLYYRERGYDPDAVLNFLARLGWGPKVDDKTTKVLPKERMLQLFLEGGSMRASLANMDLHKLEAYDRKYKAMKGVWRNRDTLI
jgi:glutamyl-tRNA synthetase